MRTSRGECAVLFAENSRSGCLGVRPCRGSCSFLFRRPGRCPWPSAGRSSRWPHRRSRVFPCISRSTRCSSQTLVVPFHQGSGTPPGAHRTRGGRRHRVVRRDRDGVSHRIYAAAVVAESGERHSAAPPPGRLGHLLLAPGAVEVNGSCLAHWRILEAVTRAPRGGAGRLPTPTLSNIHSKSPSGGLRPWFR